MKAKKNKILFLLVIFFVLSAGAEAKKVPVEKDADIVVRLTKSELLEKQISRSQKLITKKNVLVAFTKSAVDADGNYGVDLNILIPDVKNNYEVVQTEACEIEGGSPTLRSFFFVHADASRDLSIGVICGWDATHQGADCSTSDEVRFFKISKDLSSVELLKDKKFSDFYREEKPEKNSDFTCKKSNFSTAGDVRKLLTKIGYKN